MICLWLLCFPLAVVVPVIVGLFFGIFFPYKIIVDLCSNFDRARHGNYKKFSFIILIVFSIVFFQLLLYICLAVFILIAALVAIFAIVCICPIIIVWVPYYLIRITVLSCRTLK